MRKKSTPSSNKWLTLLFACLLLSCTVCNAATTETLKPDTITLSLTEAGTLHERIGNNKKLKIECLRLKGMLSNVQKITSAENLRSRASDEIVPFREFIIKDDTSALL